MFQSRTAALALGTILAVGIAASAPTASAAPTGFIDTDRFGYSGTINRYNTLSDAQSGTNAIDNITVGDRDLSLFIRNDIPGQSNYNIAMGSWWYTTNPQGRAGSGNTRGNTGVGFMQIFDSDGSTDTSIDMVFDDFNGSEYTTFRLSMEGEKATTADDVARLSAIDNVNDAGVYENYRIELEATGLSGTDSDNDGLIEASGGQPTGVSGSMSGLFKLTENETSPANQGFYTFDFDLSMTNWAWENRNSLTTQNEDGEVISDTFPTSTFVASVPLPGTASMLGAALFGLGGVAAARRRGRG